MQLSDTAHIYTDDQEVSYNRRVPYQAKVRISYQADTPSSTRFHRRSSTWLHWRNNDNMKTLREIGNHNTLVTS